MTFKSKGSSAYRKELSYSAVAQVAIRLLIAKEDAAWIVGKRGAESKERGELKTIKGILRLF